MDLDKLLAELDGIGRIARSWKEQDRVAEIERQIILDKLRHIYEKVMFSGGVEVCESPAGKQTGTASGRSCRCCGWWSSRTV